MKKHITPLPDKLLDLEPLAKAVWLYLRPLGEVKVSQRALAKKLGFTQTGLSLGFQSLRDNHLVVGSFEKGKTATYQAVLPD